MPTLFKNKKIHYQSSLQPTIKTLKVVKNIPSDLRYDEAIGIDGTSSKKLRAGKFNVEAKLDLHGMSQHNAFLNLQTFIKKVRHFIILLVVVLQTAINQI